MTSHDLAPLHLPPPLTPCSQNPNTTAFWLFHRYGGFSSQFPGLTLISWPRVLLLSFSISASPHDSRLSSNISSSKEPTPTSSQPVALISLYFVSLSFISAKLSLTQITLFVYCLTPLGCGIPEAKNLADLPMQVYLCLQDQPLSPKWKDLKESNHLTDGIIHSCVLFLSQKKEAFHSSTI